MDFLTLAKDRYSARSFVGGEIPPEILAALQEQGLISAEDMPAEIPADEAPVMQPVMRMMPRLLRQLAADKGV